MRKTKNQENCISFNFSTSFLHNVYCIGKGLAVAHSAGMNGQPQLVNEQTFHACIYTYISQYGSIVIKNNRTNNLNSIQQQESV